MDDAKNFFIGDSQSFQLRNFGEGIPGHVSDPVLPQISAGVESGWGWSQARMRVLLAICYCTQLSIVCTCILVTLVHAQLRSVGMVSRLRLAQSILPSCKLHVHAAGHTHGAAVAVPTTAAKRVAAHTANVLQRSVFVSDGIFTKRATPRGPGVYVIRKKT